MDSEIVLNPEQVYFQEGLEQGIREDKVSFQEGEAMGYSTGLEIGSRVGFILNFATHWSLAEQAELLPQRSRKMVDTLLAMATQFPQTNEQVNISKLLETLERKFKATQAVLGTKLTLPGQPDSQKITF